MGFILTKILFFTLTVSAALRLTVQIYSLTAFLLKRKKRQLKEGALGQVSKCLTP